MNRPVRSTVPTILGELGLAVLGAFAALWVLQRTGSVLLAAWSCFLVQALRVRIPARRARGIPKHAEDARFERARCLAETALARFADREGRRRPARTNPPGMYD